MLKVLIACEFSGTVREAFKKQGCDAWSCDLLPTEIPGQHIQDDVVSILNRDWDLIIAHPPCTYLANSGVRHLHSNVKSKNGKQASISGPLRWTEMYKACDFFNKILNAKCRYVCVENPVPHKYAREKIGKYTQIIQPWQFGHGETKATCLWLKNLPNLLPTKIVDGRYPRIHLMSQSKDRWKKRSITYQGIADAMASQFTKFIKEYRVV